MPEQKDAKIERDSFVFYRSFYEAIKDLPRDIQGEIYTAIMEYSLNGNETDNLKPVAKSVFVLIKPLIDSNNKKYKNGCSGGRPKTKKEPKNNLHITNTKPNEDDNDNVNENVDEDNDPTLFKLEDCYTVALRDNDWVEASGANGDKLAEFNMFLKGQGIKKKNPADYKQHFYHWWKKSGNQVPGKREGVMSIQPSMAELKAKEFLKNR